VQWHSGGAGGGAEGSLRHPVFPELGGLHDGVLVFSCTGRRSLLDTTSAQQSIMLLKPH